MGRASGCQWPGCPGPAHVQSCGTEDKLGSEQACFLGLLRAGFTGTLHHAWLSSHLFQLKYKNL